CRFLRGEACDYWKLAQWYAIRRIHPESAFGLGHRLDRGEMLHPIGSGPARHDETRRKAIEVRQRRSIHFIGHERGVLDRLPGRDALDEVGGLVGNARIGAVEDDLDRLLLKADLVQKVLEPRAFPARAAHRAVAPLHPGDVRLEKAAPVA